MAFQTVFMRYEMKYILTLEQKEKIIQAIKPYMQLDNYGRTTIRNIYFDTDNYRLIRRSIEKPAYKEKLRIRSYSQASPYDTVFVELKKKYNQIVYKRRLPLTRQEAMDWVLKKQGCPETTQISEEIDYFLNYYEELKPTVFLSYDREAFFSKDNSDFRVTFDDNILCRTENLSLGDEIYGTALLKDKTALMEIKCSGGIPMWMVKILSKEHIYKTVFSKYGTAYRTMIFPKLKEGYIYA